MPVAVDLDELVTVVGYAHLVAGFDNRQLTTLVSTALDAPYTRARGQPRSDGHPGPALHQADAA
jgi:hypothetical protein